MGVSFEELEVLQEAEGIADDVWDAVKDWDFFAKDTVGKQLARAVDSVGANIAEAYGRFHFGEKLNFLYYARGSLFETKYWINRAMHRALIDSEFGKQLAERLTKLARRLNQFAKSTRAQRKSGKATSGAKTLKEESVSYVTGFEEGAQLQELLFDDVMLSWLQKHQAPTRHPLSTSNAPEE